jgi:glycosyltransferase involved in cell wall biosynthesis
MWATGPSGWPHEGAEAGCLPPTLPDGTAWPKISVVTPSYNQGKYIEETILSVAKQAYPNVEHIVIDGGSTDETVEILERHRGKLAYVVSESDRGQSHAINKGMAHASGSLLTWLNSDDMLAPGALAAMALAFWSSGADIVAGICQLYSGGELVGQHLTSCEEGPLPLNDLLDLDGGWNAGQFFYQPEVMFRRELWEKAGGYVEEKLYYSMDYEMWVRFAEAGARIHVIGRPVAWFRQHAEQKTHVQSKFMTELSEWRDAYVERSGRSFTSRGNRSGQAPLKVMFLNDLGYQFGAGVAHRRMIEMLGLAGHEVLPMALVDHPLPAHIDPSYTREQLQELLKRYQPDLVVVGNLHAAKGEPWIISALAERCPTLVVMHDLWLLTGRCAYTAGCDKYLTGCDDSCPTPDEYPPMAPARIASAWRAKKQTRDTANLTLLTNSQWAAGVARGALASTGARTPVETFNLSFPLDIYQPLDKEACRRELGLPRNRFLVLITSEFKEVRKGTQYVLQALQELALADVTVVSTSWSEADAGEVGSLELIRLGYQSDPRRLAMAYAAADITVGASSEETFGQVFIESIACGTPAIGFAVTGVTEAIRDGVTGRLAGRVGVADLAEAILELYQNPELRRNMGLWGRIYVENEWSPYSAYLHMFRALNRLGLLDRLRTPHKISFLPTPPPLPHSQLLAHRHGQWPHETDLCGVEGPLLEYDLPKFRWALGPATRLVLEAEHEGTYLVAISYRNLHPEQRVSIEVNDQIMGSNQIAVTGMHDTRLTTFDVKLTTGRNAVRLLFSRWCGPLENHRPLAMIVTKIKIIAEPSAVPVFLASAAAVGS